MADPTTDDVTALARLIWETSRADESTISALGADIVAGAILRSRWLAERDARIRAKAWDEGFIARLGDTPLYKSSAEWGNPYRVERGESR